MEALLAFPRHFFSRVGIHRKVFADTSEGAAEHAANLVVDHMNNVDAAKYVQKLREREKDNVQGRRFAEKGYCAVELVLSRRMAEVSADLSPAFWRAGGMDWEKFVECAEQLRTQLVQQLSPGVDDPRVAEVLDVVRSARFPTQPETGDDDEDSR
jgi:hypothetical protein